MLSIEKCRALIPDGDKMSDNEITAVRNDLYEMARLALDVWRMEKNSPHTPTAMDENPKNQHQMRKSAKPIAKE